MCNWNSRQKKKVPSFKATFVTAVRVMPHYMKRLTCNGCRGEETTLQSYGARSNSTYIPSKCVAKVVLIQDLDSSFNSNLSFPNPRGRCVAYLLCSIPIALMAHIQNLEAPCKADAIRIEDLATQCLCQSRRTVIWQ